MHLQVTKGTSEGENVHIKANENVEGKNGLDELSRLTAEFESFVKNSENDVHQEPRLIINEDEIITTTNDNRVNDEKEKAQEKKSEDVEIIIDEEKKPSKEEEKPKISVDVGRVTTLSVEKIESPATTNGDENVERISEHHVVVRNEIESQNKTIAIIQEDLKIKEIELKIKEDELRFKEALEEVNNNNKALQIEKVNGDDDCLRREKISQVENQIKSKELTPDIQTLEVHQITTEIRKFPDIQRITPTPTPSREETPDFIPLPVREKFDVLRIDENENDLQKPEDIKEEKSLSNIQIQEMKILNTKERSPTPPKIIVNESQQEKLTQVKILQQSPLIQEPRIIRDRTPIPLARTEIESRLSSQGFIKVEKPLKYDVSEQSVLIRRQNSQPDAEDDDVVLRGGEAPKVPERRRSVKDIIESINRHQQKLKVNQPASPQLPRKKYYFGEQKFSYHEKPALPPKENVLLKLQRQAENERKINALLDDLQDFSKENSDIRRTQKFPVTERDTNNNSTISHERLSRDGINPIPKPRRVM